MKAGQVVKLADWTVKLPKLPSNFSHALVKVKPLFDQWMVAGEAYEKNTGVVAEAMRKALELFTNEFPDGTRVDFARYFDESIAEDAKVRDLGTNRTYNRINYLVDKVGIESDDDGTERAPRVSIVARRAKIHRMWVRFASKYSDGRTKITLGDVEALMKKTLGEVWKKEIVSEIVASDEGSEASESKSA